MILKSQKNDWIWGNINHEKGLKKKRIWAYEQIIELNIENVCQILFSENALAQNMELSALPLC